MINFDINKFLNIGISLSAQRDMALLLETIVNEAMCVANADAGTLYILENDMLHFKIMRNISMQLNTAGYNDEITLPPVGLTEENVCSYVVIHRELENIEDVYYSEKFDFSGPRKYDAITGYLTRSMLVVPLEDNKGQVVGVVQLMNAMDEEGQIVPFDKEFELIFRSFASQAAIAVTNMRYTKEIKDSFYSFIEVMSTAVDERTPYNARHTRNVALYTIAFIDFINEQHSEGKTDFYLDPNTKEQVVMAAWLHDVGKVVTPLEVMNKATRLDMHFPMVMDRFEIMRLNCVVDHLSKNTTDEEFKILNDKICGAIELIKRIDSAPFVDIDDAQKVREVAKNTYFNDQGILDNWLSEDEVECLSIKRGTLTPEERKIMEDHVVVTQKLLSKIKFTSEYGKVASIASSHHERLNGKGYPLGISSEKMSTEVRILAIMDVFEALTAKDRPYKKAMPIEKAFEIFDVMVNDGDLDGRLVELLKRSNIWLLKNNSEGNGPWSI